jgi:hypothetical protein
MDTLILPHRNNTTTARKIMETYTRITKTKSSKFQLEVFSSTVRDWIVQGEWLTIEEAKKDQQMWDAL